MAASGLAAAFELDEDDWLPEPPELELFLVSPQAAATRASAATRTNPSSRRRIRDEVMPSPPVAGSVVPRRAAATRRAGGMSARAPRGRAGRGSDRAPSRSAAPP